MTDEDVDQPRYAGFPSRAVAYVIDTIVILIATSGGVLITSATLNALFPTHKELEVNPYLFGTILWLVGGAYFAGFWTFTGSTPAMYIFGLRLTRMDGERVGILRAILRYLAFAISALFFGLGYAWVLFDRRHQAWHDKIARTVMPYKETTLVRPGQKESSEA